ncbi:MAG: hypothetical protein ACRCXT_18040 [Paraclostridium sp.]
MIFIYIITIFFKSIKIVGEAFNIILLPFRFVAWLFSPSSNNNDNDAIYEEYSARNYEANRTPQDVVDFIKLHKNIFLFILFILIIIIIIYIFYKVKNISTLIKNNKKIKLQNTILIKKKLYILNTFKNQVNIEKKLNNIPMECISIYNSSKVLRQDCLVLKYVFKKKQLKILNEIHKKTFDLSTIKILIKEMESLEKKLEFDQIESSIISELSNGKNLELEKNILAESKIIENKENETHLLAKIFSTTWFNERAIKKHSQELQKLKKEIQNNQEYLSKRLSSEQKLKSEMDEISKKLQVEINLLLEFLIAKNESFIKEMGS